MQRKSQVVVAHAPELRQRVFRFRYDVYVKELAYDHPEAVHATETISDAMDEYSTIYALTDESGAVQGTVRCTILADLPDPQRLIEKFGMERFVADFGLPAIGTTSRFMLAKQTRRTTDILKLLRVSAGLALDRNVRFNFGETNAVWLDYFETLGYRRYSRQVNDPTFGLHIPIVMLVRDCVFRRIPAWHSDANQPVIPTEASHLFRGIPAAPE